MHYHPVFYIFRHQLLFVFTDDIMGRVGVICHIVRNYDNIFYYLFITTFFVRRHKLFYSFLIPTSSPGIRSMPSGIFTRKGRPH